MNCAFHHQIIITTESREQLFEKSQRYGIMELFLMFLKMEISVSVTTHTPQWYSMYTGTASTLITTWLSVTIKQL